MIKLAHNVKKERFVLTITTHTETEFLVREGRLHRFKENKDQGPVETVLTSEKQKKQTGENNTNYTVNTLDYFLKEKKYWKRALL